ncbi:MAG: SDR family NAD(P)-dependent oxidoreductase, partial [Candidatus Marinimicrobia bacterium]|nr:SDR family NAD(P)-dependent oxidoreductase [Candidatus Neomarinimicrobiota bacterium]
NRTIMITGASSGIGEACAHAFAQAGAALVLLARRKQRLETLKKQLEESHGTEAAVMVCDVSDRKQVEDAFRNLPKRWQAIDVLVNGAGLALGADREWEVSAEYSDRMIDTNIKGLLTMTKLCVPGMISRGRGHVINLGSVAGHEAYPNGSVYCATKFAVRALSRGLKMDLTGTPVRVTSIDPGMVETEFSLVRFAGDESQAAEAYKNMQPLTAADIAEMVLFAATRPPHVNISEMLVFPTHQSAARMVHREPEQG